MFAVSSIQLLQLQGTGAVLVTTLTFGGKHSLGARVQVINDYANDGDPDVGGAENDCACTLTRKGILILVPRCDVKILLGQKQRKNRRWKMQGCHKLWSVLMHIAPCAGMRTAQVARWAVSLLINSRVAGGLYVSVQIGLLHRGTLVEGPHTSQGLCVLP